MRIKWTIFIALVLVIGFFLVDNRSYLSAENVDLGQFQITYPTLGKVRDVIIAKGKIVYDHQFKFRSHVSGRVTDFTLSEGDKVERGQDLLRIIESHVAMDLKAAKIELQHSQNKINVITKDIHDIQRLVKVGGMSSYELEQKRLELDSAIQDKQRVQLDIDRLELNQKLSSLISPVQGMVVSIAIQNNLRVNTGDELLSIAGGDGLYVAAYIDAIDAERIYVGQTVVFSEQEDSIQRRRGKVKEIGRLITDLQRPNSVKVTIEPLDSIQDLLLSQQLYVEVVIIEEDLVMRIPQELVYQEQDQQIVYVLTDSGDVVSRAVVTVPGDITFVKVVSGVSLTDRLVPKSNVGGSY